MPTTWKTRLAKYLWVQSHRDQVKASARRYRQAHRARYNAASAARMRRYRQRLRVTSNPSPLPLPLR